MLADSSRLGLAWRCHLRLPDGHPDSARRCPVLPPRAARAGHITVRLIWWHAHRCQNGRHRDRCLIWRRSKRHRLIWRQVAYGLIWHWSGCLPALQISQCCSERGCSRRGNARCQILYPLRQSERVSQEFPQNTSAGPWRYRYRPPRPRLIEYCCDLASPTRGRILAAFDYCLSADAPCLFRQGKLCNDTN